MATTPEGKVKNRIKALFKKYEVPFLCPTTGGYGHSGWFDFVACVHGRFLGVEAKADSTKFPTALQTMCADEIYRAGGVVLLIHGTNLEVLEDILIRMLDGTLEFKGVKVWPSPRLGRSTELGT